MSTPDPDILIDLLTAKTEFEAGIIAATLRDAGIEAWVFAHAGSTLQWEVAMTQPIRVAVKRIDEARARETLATVKRDSIDIDWAEAEKMIVRGPAPDVMSAEDARRFTAEQSPREDPDAEDPNRYWRFAIAAFAVIMGGLLILAALKGQPVAR